MDLYTVTRTVGALAVVLGLLAGALWAVRRFDIRLPGRVGGGTLRRTELVERTQIDARRSVALLRRDGREHLILLSPEGNTIIEAGIVRDALDLEAQAQREAEAAQRRREAEEAVAAARAEMERLRASFADMVEAHQRKARRSLRPLAARAGVSARRWAGQLRAFVARAGEVMRSQIEAWRGQLPRPIAVPEPAPAPVIALLPAPTTARPTPARAKSPRKRVNGARLSTVAASTPLDGRSR